MFFNLNQYITYVTHIVLYSSVWVLQFTVSTSCMMIGDSLEMHWWISVCGFVYVTANAGPKSRSHFNLPRTLERSGHETTIATCIQTACIKRWRSRCGFVHTCRYASGHKLILQANSCSPQVVSSCDHVTPVFILKIIALHFRLPHTRTLCHALFASVTCNFICPCDRIQSHDIIIHHVI